MKKQVRNIIWSNENIDIDEYKENIDPEIAEDMTDSELWEAAYEENSFWLDDERANLNIQLDEEILVIANLGLWNGRHNAVKVIKSGKIADCLYDSCDYLTWYCDEYNFRAEAAHHDGRNYYLYRAFRPGLSDEQKENFIDALRYNEANERMIRRYTVSLQPIIAKVYGWKIHDFTRKEKTALPTAA